MRRRELGADGGSTAAGGCSSSKEPGRRAGPRKRRGTATVTLVSQPEMQRQVRQQRADIDSLYELVESVDRKVDTLDEKVSALDVKLDRRLDELSGQLAEVLRQLGGR